jgi:hypothetical protein
MRARLLKLPLLTAMALGLATAGPALGESPPLLFAAESHPAASAAPAGAVRDPQTGLIWTQRDNGSDVNWEQAKSYCDGLTLGGYRWTLPTIEQLEKIYDASVSDDCGPESAFLSVGGKRKRITCHARLGIHLTAPWVLSGTEKGSLASWSFAFPVWAVQNPARSDFASPGRALCVCSPR